MKETASFFSAYKVENSFIPTLEALLIRVCANNLINTRMEKINAGVANPLRQVNSVGTK